MRSSGYPLVGGSPPWRFVLAAVTAAVFIDAGCLNSDWIRRDVASSRQQAFRAWQCRQAADLQVEPLIRGDLTLEDALKLALVYSKPLQATVQEKEIGRGRLVESYAEALPTVSAVTRYTRVDVGGRNVSLASADQYAVGLEVRQPVFRGGAIKAAIRAAQVLAALSDEKVRGQVQQTINDVAQAYFDALLAQQLQTVYEDAVRSAEAHLKDVEQKRAGGVASEYDVLRARVDVSNFRAEMIQQRNRVHLAKTRLFKAMGVSQDSAIILKDELVYEDVAVDPSEAVRLALENRPDLHQAELAVRLEEESLRVAQGRYWPRLDLVLTQEWGRPDPRSPGIDHWGDQWVAGAVLEWPLFDGLRREGQVIQQRAALRQRRIELVDAQEQALLEVQQAILTLRDTEEFVESQRLNLDRAAEGLRLAEVGYREGINTEVEVTDARAALTRARGLYYQAIYDHTIARLSLQRAMGVLGPRAGDTAVPTESPVRPAHVPEFRGEQPAAGAPMPAPVSTKPQEGKRPQ